MSLSLSVILANVKNSLITDKRNLIQKIQYDSKLNDYQKMIKVLNIVKDRNSFKKEINFFVTDRSFKDYYKFEEYSKFKKIVGEARVASIGIDPMMLS